MFLFAGTNLQDDAARQCATAFEPPGLAGDVVASAQWSGSPMAVTEGPHTLYRYLKREWDIGAGNFYLLRADPTP